MNRRQFLSLIPAAAVAGTAAAATAAAPKSLSLEEGLLSAWRKCNKWLPQLCEKGLPCKAVKFHLSKYGNTLTLNGSEVQFQEQSEEVKGYLLTIFDSQKEGLFFWTETEQGPMRLCPHSLRWFPYTPKESI